MAADELYKHLLHLATLDQPCLVKFNLTTFSTAAPHDTDSSFPSGVLAFPSSIASAFLSVTSSYCSCEPPIQ